LSKTRDQQAASAVPHSTQNASSSSTDTGSPSNVSDDATYHDDSWNTLVDVPPRDASDLKVSQDVQISVPVAVAPASDTPKTLQ
jgi:hypothetical protein